MIHILRTFIHDNPILLTSILAACLSSISGGIIGSYVVVKRIVSISGSIAHSILGCLGLSIWLKYKLNLEFISPMYGAIIGSIILAIFIGWIHIKYKEREDALIAMIWSIGMAVGIILISSVPVFNKELLNFLLGNILWVQKSDLFTLLILNIIIISSSVLFHNKFLALCFDEDQVFLRGKSVTYLYLLLLSLIALTTVLLLYIMGIILVLSMLTLPVCIASKFSHNLKHIIFISVILNIIFSITGVLTAYYMDWPVGPSIALLSGSMYGVSLFFKTEHNS